MMMMMKKKKKENEGIDSDDPFLRLPEPLLQCILSYLTCKDLGRTSILSKRWKNLWITTSTTLQFNEDFFGNVLKSLSLEYDEDLFGNVKPSWMQDPEKTYAKREYLMNVVERTLCSRHNKKASLEELVLCVPPCTSDMIACLDRCINYAIGCNVKQLSFNDASECYYTLPRTVFTSKTLTDLSLQWGSLNSLSSSSSSSSSSSCLSLPSLKALKFLSVSADAQTIQNLIESCPVIEVLWLDFCHGSKSRTLNISGSKLVTVEISYCEFGRVEIEAPSLESLIFIGRCDIIIGVSTCRNIKKLRLQKAAITDEWFHDQLSGNFLFEELEDLKLNDCDMVKTITISSHRLKHLSVCMCRNLVQLKIDGHNLRTFVYDGSPDQNVISFSPNTLELLRSDISLHSSYVDTIWYVKLVEFLGSLNNSKILKLQSEFVTNFIVPKELRESLPPPLYNAKHLILELQRYLTSSEVLEIVDGLLWLSPHPTTISITSYNGTRVLKFLYKEMDKDGNPSCCSSLPIKCWRHCIQLVKIKTSKGDEAEWHNDSF